MDHALAEADMASAFENSMRMTLKQVSSVIGGRDGKSTGAV